MLETGDEMLEATRDEELKGSGNSSTPKTIDIAVCTSDEDICTSDEAVESGRKVIKRKSITDPNAIKKRMRENLTKEQWGRLFARGLPWLVATALVWLISLVFLTLIRQGVNAYCNNVYREYPNYCDVFYTNGNVR